ncbi:hypothetical protein Emag_003459 [Eimeria magna]
MKVYWERLRGASHRGDRRRSGDVSAAGFKEARKQQQQPYCYRLAAEYARLSSTSRGFALFDTQQQQQQQQQLFKQQQA